MSRITAPSTRSSSFASDSSTYSTLDTTARTILTKLCNDREFSEVSKYVLEDVMVQHDDNEPITSREAFLQGWQTALQRMPDFHMNIKEACVDENQLKVWVRSEITGLPGGIRKESIDMMTFNAEGLLISSVDCQRKLKLRDYQE